MSKDDGLKEAGGQVIHLSTKMRSWHYPHRTSDWFCSAIVASSGAGASVLSAPTAR